jgi:ATP-dependent DNA helicase RecG
MKVTTREEIQRIFQAAGLIHADEVPARGMTVADIDMEYFKKYFQERWMTRKYP